MGVGEVHATESGEGRKYLPNIIQTITEVVLVGRCPDRLKGKGKKGDDF